MKKPTRFNNLINNPEKKGELAAEKHLFGKCNRYAIAPVHSREIMGESNICWAIWDTEVPDTLFEKDPVLGYPPAIIVIADSYEKAMSYMKV